MNFIDLIFGKETKTNTQKNSSSGKARRLRFEGLESREMLSITGFEAAVAISTTSAKISWNSVAGASRYRITCFNTTTNQWTTLTTTATIQ